MRPDCLSSKTCAALAVAFAALSVAACGSSGNNGGSTVHVDGGGGAAGSGAGGATIGGSGGQATGGAGGQAAGGTGGAGGAGSCTTDYGQTATCKACLQKNCCAEATACAADSACKAFVACDEKCPNPLDTSSTCVKACVDAGAPGTAYNGLILCMQKHCASPTCSYP